MQQRVSEIIEKSLSGDSIAVKEATAEWEGVRSNPDIGAALLSIFESRTFSALVRQQAATFLRRAEHSPPLPVMGEKLTNCLVDSDSGVQLAAATTIAHFVNEHSPLMWPELPQVLHNVAQTSNSGAIIAAKCATLVLEDCRQVIYTTDNLAEGYFRLIGQLASFSDFAVKLAAVRAAHTFLSVPDFDEPSVYALPFWEALMALLFDDIVHQHATVDFQEAAVSVFSDGFSVGDPENETYTKAVTTCGQLLHHYSLDPKPATSQLRAMCIDYFSEAVALEAFANSTLPAVFNDLMPLIMRSLRYTEEDLKELQLGVDAGIEDDEQELGADDGGDDSADDDDFKQPECSETPRIAAGNFLSSLSMLADKEPVKAVLPFLSRFLADQTNWMEVEAVMIALSEVCEALYDLMTSDMRSSVVDMVMKLQQHEVAPVRQAAIKVYGRMFLASLMDAEQPPATLVCGTVIERMIQGAKDGNKAVQQATLQSIDSVFSAILGEDEDHFEDADSDDSDSDAEVPKMSQPVDKPQLIRIFLQACPELLRGYKLVSRVTLFQVVAHVVEAVSDPKPLVELLGFAAEHVCRVEPTSVEFSKLAIEFGSIVEALECSCTVFAQTIIPVIESRLASLLNSVSGELSVKQDDAACAIIDLLSSFCSAMHDGIAGYLHERAAMLNAFVELLKEQYNPSMELQRAVFAILGDVAVICSAEYVAPMVASVAPRCVKALNDVQLPMVKVAGNAAFCLSHLVCKVGCGSSTDVAGISVADIAKLAIAVLDDPVTVDSHSLVAPNLCLLLAVLMGQYPSVLLASAAPENVKHATHHLAYHAANLGDDTNTFLLNLAAAVGAQPSVFYPPHVVRCVAKSLKSANEKAIEVWKPIMAQLPQQENPDLQSAEAKRFTQTFGVRFDAHKSGKRAKKQN